MLFKHLLLFITLFSNTNAEPANKAAVEGFLECLNSYNASSIYAYAVSTQGYLILGPLQDIHSTDDVDLKPFSICNRMFGISFDCTFDFGARTFNPTYQLKNLNGVVAEDLINEGLLARERNDVVFNDDEETRLSRFVAFANNLGFNADQIRDVLGFDTNPLLDKMN
jgi:hypothetical protein